MTMVLLILFVALFVAIAVAAPMSQAARHPPFAVQEIRRDTPGERDNTPIPDGIS